MKLPQQRTSYAAIVTALMGILCVAVIGVAQPPDQNEASPGSAPPAAPAVENLATKQGEIAERYARLEQLLIRMSEVEATSNPQRAALLKRAALQSSEKLTRQQLNALVKFLTPPSQLKRATDEQALVIADLKALLELLQSENRADRLKSEQARIKDYIKEVDRLIRLQRGVQGRTEGGDDPAKLAQDQGQIGDRTGRLARQIAETEEGKNAGDASAGKDDASPPGEKEAGDGSIQQDEGKSGKKSPSDSKQESGKKSSDKSDDKSGGEKGDSQSGDKSGEKSGEKSGGAQKSGGDKKSSGKGSKSSGSGEPSESPESEATPGGEQSPQDQQTQNPARKRLQAAEERMREAERKLAEAKQKDAAADQEQAREELEKAKAELEQILRQMREEEIERTLALLEGRFRQMLEGQLKIHEATKRLDKIPAAERSRDVDIQASKLSFEQGKLAVDADRALLLLREEGSSVAFPETVEMMRDDMQQVSNRLSLTQVDQLTQAIEEEIIETLEELIAALQKAQQDLKDMPPPPPGQQQPMDPSDRPLVDQLAELRMIKSLQLRVNTRTQRYARLLEDVNDPVGRANDAELRQSLFKLSDMESKIHEITRNLVLGKNR